jgi:hypothetical protein
LRRTVFSASRDAMRARAAWAARATMASPVDRFSCSHCSNTGRSPPSTAPRTSGLLSRPLVWPWNWGSRTRTDNTPNSALAQVLGRERQPAGLQPVGLDERAQRLAEGVAPPLLVGAAVLGGDAVDVRRQPLPRRVRPPDGEPDLHAVGDALGHERDVDHPPHARPLDHRPEVVGEAAVVLELARRAVDLVLERDA